MSAVIERHEVEIILSGDSLKAIGDDDRVKQAMPFIHENRAAIIHCLQTRCDGRSALSGIRAVIAGYALKGEETALQWRVNTADRGAIRVTCYPPHTLADILEGVPGAVSAVPLLEKQT